MKNPVLKKGCYTEVAQGLSPSRTIMRTGVSYTDNGNFLGMEAEMHA